MKKIKLVLFSLVVLATTSFGQAKTAAWPEMKTFHSYMAGTFHPSEEGDLKPLKEKADSLFNAAKAWQASEIPANYKPAETKAALKKLVEQCRAISVKVKESTSDEELKKMIADAHDTFHKLVGECKKVEEGHEGHNH